MRDGQNQKSSHDERPEEKVQTQGPVTRSLSALTLFGLLLIAIWAFMLPQVISHMGNRLTGYSIRMGWNGIVVCTAPIVLFVGIAMIWKGSKHPQKQTLSQKDINIRDGQNQKSSHDKQPEEMVQMQGAATRSLSGLTLCGILLIAIWAFMLPQVISDMGDSLTGYSIRMDWDEFVVCTAPIVMFVGITMIWKGSKRRQT